MSDFAEQPFREFARELILRLDRLHRDLSKQNAALASQNAELARQNDRASKESDAYFRHLDARLVEIQADGRAQREALFRILDRLGGGGAAPAA